MYIHDPVYFKSFAYARNPHFLCEIGSQKRGPGQGIAKKWGPGQGTANTGGPRCGAPSGAYQVSPRPVPCPGPKFHAPALKQTLPTKESPAVPQHAQANLEICQHYLAILILRLVCSIVICLTLIDPSIGARTRTLGDHDCSVLALCNL